jgi:hypothetical protein
MQSTRFSVKVCCGQTGVAIKTENIISKEMIPIFTSKGYKEDKKYTNAGVLYIENDDITITGALNAKIFQIKCKPNKKCLPAVFVFEELLNTI